MMPRFFIEVPHTPDVVGCARVVKIFLSTGSHFLTNADWGCMDGKHVAWLTVDVPTREEARAILPPAFRANAEITRLTKFTMEKIDETLAKHGG
jgi:hypothetical protein